MKRIYLLAIIIALHASFLKAEEPKFKFIFGGKVGNIPVEIIKKSQNIKTLPGIKINSWILSPNFSSFIGNKNSFNFLEDKISKDKIYMKFNLRF